VSHVAWLRSELSALTRFGFTLLAPSDEAFAAAELLPRSAVAVREVLGRRPDRVTAQSAPPSRRAAPDHALASRGGCPATAARSIPAPPAPGSTGTGFIRT
jgi:hypothetical protein